MCRPSASRRPLSSAAPSRRTLPRRAARRRRAARASDDLPEALGPMMPRPWPAASAKLTSCTTSFCSPGGAALAASTDEARLRRAAAASARSAAGSSASSFVSRAQLWRAATKPRQLAMASSTGAERARSQDRAGDDDAGRRLLVDDEIGADRQARRTAASCATPWRSRRGRRPTSLAALLRLHVAAVCLAPRSPMRRPMPMAP